MVSSMSSVEQRTGGPAAEDRPPAGARAGRRRVTGWAVAVVGCGVGVLVPALLFGMSGPPRSIVELPSGGPLVTWSLPVVRLLHDIFGMLTAGALLAGVALTPASGRRLAPHALRCVRAAGMWAVWWAVCAALGLVLSLSDILGVPPTRLLAEDGALRLIGSFAQGRAGVVVTVAAMALALACGRVTTVRGGYALLGLGAFTLLPPMYTGHSASAADHDLAVSSLMVHGTATALWIGGLAAILLYLRDAREDLPTILTRFSALALACFAAAGLSGVVNVVGRFDDFVDLFTSRYGQLVLAKTLALTALAVFGLLHRRRTIDAVVQGRTRRPFLRLATGELFVMAATVGLAVALSRTPPPPGEREPSWISLQLGYDLAPLTWNRLVTVWRPDLFALVILVAAALAYAAGTRRLRGRGSPWPVKRALAWYAGLAVLAFVMLTGIGAYGRAMFSLHAIQQLVLTVLGPLLLAWSAPLTLWARARSADAAPNAGGGWTRQPPAVVAVYAVPPVVFYFTDWFVMAQFSHAVHLATQAVFLGAGFHYFRLVLAADPPAVPLGPGNRVRLLLAGLPVHLLLALALIDGPVVGENWYRQLGMMWASPGTGGGVAAEALALAADQRVGAVIYGLGTLAIFTAVLLVFVGRGWADRRRAAASPVVDQRARG